MMTVSTAEIVGKAINSLLVAARYMNSAHMTGNSKDFQLWAQHYVEAGEKLEKLGVPNVAGVDIYRSYLEKIAK